MTKRSKTIHLFNKNHITLVKTEEAVRNEPVCTINRDTVYLTSPLSKGKRRMLSAGNYIRMTCESKLGFYYEKVVYVSISSYMETGEICIVTVKEDMTTYTLTYYKRYRDMCIGVDKRPWELFEDEKAMLEHFIYDLKKQIDMLLDIIYSNKKMKIKYTGDIKKLLYKDLFGSEKGIRFQTNDEKILSHGFDLKTSFRKM